MLVDDTGASPSSSVPSDTRHHEPDAPGTVPEKTTRTIAPTRRKVTAPLDPSGKDCSWATWDTESYAASMAVA